MTTKEHMVGIQDATQELKKLLSTHKHFWLPAYDGSNHEVCGSCDTLRFETYAQAEDYYYENIATEAVDERGFQMFLLNQAEVVEQPEVEDVRDWEMQ